MPEPVLRDGGLHGDAQERYSKQSAASTPVNLAIAFNDVDLCIRIRQEGYQVIWTPYAELYHLEFASRGSDLTPENRDRFAAEVKYMQERWDDVLRSDPYYNPNLSLEATDFSLAGTPRVTWPWRASGPEITLLGERGGTPRLKCEKPTRGAGFRSATE